jgi:hypothetical protein
MCYEQLNHGKIKSTCSALQLGLVNHNGGIMRRSLENRRQPSCTLKPLKFYKFYHILSSSYWFFKNDENLRLRLIEIKINLVKSGRDINSTQLNSIIMWFVMNCSFSDFDLQRPQGKVRIRNIGNGELA